MKSSHIALSVNGREHEVLVRPGTTLVAALRESLGLTATRRGCEQGTCGTCTVLVDGKAMLSCLCLAETLPEGVRIETLEGLSPDAVHLHPLQQAFLDGFATQCGFCTSGMILAAKALLDRNPAPTRADVVRAISGNVCRCTGYESIINAVLDAAAQMRAAKPAAAA
jgi:carbon-monoxide dehydrogenase small subunit